MFEQVLNDFITNHKFDVLSGLKTTDGEYKRLLERQAEHSAVLDSHDDEAFNMMFRDYLDCIQAVHEIESNTLYLQGVKDCFKALRFFGALEGGWGL